MESFLLTVFFPFSAGASMKKNCAHLPVVIFPDQGYPLLMLYMHGKEYIQGALFHEMKEKFLPARREFIQIELLKRNGSSPGKCER